MSGTIASPVPSRSSASGSPATTTWTSSASTGDLTDGVFLPMLRPLYRTWFRIEVDGVENLPEEGAALVVANHSGTIALDALMLAVAVHDETPARRYLRLLGADLVFRMPVLSEIARKSGGTLACNPDAERLLSAGELVGVFPEGFKGVGKPFARPLQAAALRPGRLRLRRPAHRHPDRPGRDRRRRGDLPDDRQHQAAGPAARRAVLPDHADRSRGWGRSGCCRCRASG